MGPEPRPRNPLYRHSDLALSIHARFYCTGREMTRLVRSFTVSGLYRRALVEGGASALDFRGDTRRQYEFADSPELADLDAIRADWEALAEDFDAAIKLHAPVVHV